MDDTSILFDNARLYRERLTTVCELDVSIPLYTLNLSDVNHALWLVEYKVVVDRVCVVQLSTLYIL